MNLKPYAIIDTVGHKFTNCYESEGGQAKELISRNVKRVDWNFVK